MENLFEKLNCEDNKLKFDRIKPDNEKNFLL